MDGITAPGRLQALGFSDGVLRPVQKYPAQIRLLRRQRSRRLFRLIPDLHSSFGIDFGSRRIDLHRRKEAWSLNYTEPLKGISPARKGRHANGIGVFIKPSFE